MRLAQAHPASCAAPTPSSSASLGGATSFTSGLCSSTIPACQRSSSGTARRFPGSSRSRPRRPTFATRSRPSSPKTATCWPRMWTTPTPPRSGSGRNSTARSDGGRSTFGSTGARSPGTRRVRPRRWPRWRGFLSRRRRAARQWPCSRCCSPRRAFRPIPASRTHASSCICRSSFRTAARSASARRRGPGARAKPGSSTTPSSMRPGTRATSPARS